MHMLRSFISSAAILAVAVTVSAQTGARSAAQQSPPRLSPEARSEAIRRAQVWKATDVPSMDLRAGPQGPGAFQPNETVTCTYVDKEMTGKSPKFTCALKPDDDVKVKYGQDNGEVYGEVAATRLLWALGFGADHMYPVRVVCRGCSPDPQRDKKGRSGEVVFDFAAIERKMPGHTLETKEDSGWGWPDLDLVDEASGGAPRAQRDALKLLAVFLQHTDNKPAQQRLICLTHLEEGKPCPEPFLMLNDLGLTFGKANAFNRNAPGSVNFEKWSQTPVWKDAKGCVGNLSKSMTGTLGDPVIGEPGRKFVADLLVQLSDAQLHDLFDVARFPLRLLDGGEPKRVTVEEWVNAFKHKRDEVVTRTCAP